MNAINAICSIEDFAGAGVGGVFRLTGSNIAVQGRLVKAGAVGATVTLHTTNTPDDATSWLPAGALVLAGNDDVNAKASLASALAYGRLTISGMTAGAALKVSVSAGGFAIVDMSAFAATIPNGASLSNAIDLGGLRAGNLVMPAAWTANSLGFLVSHNGTDYSTLFDDTDTEVLITTDEIVTGRARALPLSLFYLYRWLKLRSGTMTAPANQDADRVFKIIAG